MSFFEETDIRQKLELVNPTLTSLLNHAPLSIPKGPARNIEVVAVTQMPAKTGLSKIEGQARLLHDVANIEIQALEMCIRGLAEYPDAPEEFREQLASIAKDEARHFESCINEIQHLGFNWGDWPCHLGLWGCLSSSDSLLDRVFIVHRYLEGSGLDASAILLRRLSGVGNPTLSNLIDMIGKEEISHVAFGNDWFKKLVFEKDKPSPPSFYSLLNRLRERLPIRREPLSKSMRLKAGFTEIEIEDLDRYRMETFPKALRQI